MPEREATICEPISLVQPLERLNLQVALTRGSPAPMPLLRMSYD